MTRIKSIFLIVLAGMLLATTVAWAGGIKERMTQRLPVIEGLKAQGVVGENNQGYLGFVSSNRTKQDVVAAENQDRKTIYAHIAKQQNVSVELVQSRRAKALADRAKPGHYIQNASGAWIKK